MPYKDPKAYKKYHDAYNKRRNAERKKKAEAELIASGLPKKYRKARKFTIGERIYVPMEMSNATVVLHGRVSGMLDVDIEYDGVALTIPIRWAIKKGEAGYKEVRETILSPKDA